MEESKEKCVLCHKELKDFAIRIDGAGNLCTECYIKVYEKDKIDELLKKKKSVNE